MKNSIPDKFKAAVLRQLNSPLEIIDVELPSSLEVGQVLVKVEYSGICGSQLGEIDGVKGEDVFLPHLLGHEGVGTVLRIGPGVSNFVGGETVVMHWRKGLGIQSAPPTYCYQGSTINAGWVTTFNEYSVVSENRLTRLPENADKSIGCLFGCATTTGFGVIENDAQLQAGETVVVFGAGGIGLSAIQAAAILGAYPIIAIDRFLNRLDLATKVGATHTFDTSSDDSIDRMLASIEERYGIDVLIENTGNTQVIEAAFRGLSTKGRLVLVGVPRQGDEVKIDTLPLHFGKQITGSEGGEAVPQDDIPRLQKLSDAKALDLSSLITDTFSLDEVNVAIEKMRNGDVAGRCVLRMD